MTREEALQQLQAILGKGLYPTAIPKVEEILKTLEEGGFQAGYEEAVETASLWYEPKPLGY